jgi:hypothetical protein
VAALKFGDIQSGDRNATQAGWSGAFLQRKEDATAGSILFG